MPARDFFASYAWTVWESFTGAEYREALGWSLGGPGAYPYFRLAQVQRPESIRAHHMRVLGTREHEWTHFRQYISTPYGLFHQLLWDIRSYSLDMFRLARPDFRGPMARAVQEVIEQGFGAEWTAWPRLWEAARALEVVLVNGNTTMATVKAAWGICSRFNPGTLITLPSGYVPRQLVARRDDDEEATPRGTFSCEQIVEAFAVYRESQELLTHFPRDDVGRYFVERDLSINSEGGTAHAYVAEQLGLPFGHPFTGALLEAALLTFVNPELLGAGDALVWEEIHPGMRFQVVVADLARAGGPHPENPEDAYAVARHLYGIDADTAINAQWATVNEIFPKLSTPASAGTENLVRRNLFRQRLTFAKAMRLRQDHPWIYYEPALRNWENDRALYRSVVRLWSPPVVVSPVEVVVNPPEELDLLDGLASLLASIAATVRHDLERDGQLRLTLRLVRLIPRDWGIRDMLQGEIETLLGAQYDETTREQIEEAFGK